MKFFARSAIAAFALTASVVTADDISYVDVTTTPEVTTSMVSTVESTSTPYTTTTISSSLYSQPNTTTVTGNCSSTTNELSSFEGDAANRKVAAAGLGAAIGAVFVAML